MVYNGISIVSNPARKPVTPTAPPLAVPQHLVPASSISSAPLSLFFPPCYPPGRIPALGKVQGFGPSVPEAVWAAGAELCPLQERRAVPASCLVSSGEAAGHE